MRYSIIDNFLSPTECSELIKLAKPRLEPSMEVNPTTGQDQVTNSRISSQAYLDLLENSLVAYIEKRISTITNTPIENGESIQVVYYEPGGYFAAHSDDFEHYEGKNPLDEGGHRIITFMVYLNDVPEGGDTYFHKIDLSVQPQQGKAFWWYNLKEDGTRDIDTDHAARPTPTPKWIATKWIRQNVAI